MKCPRCGLLNPDIAQRCDCGYDFEARTVKTPYGVPPSPKRSWLRAVAAGMIAAILPGLPTGVALLILLQGNEQFWVQRFPVLFGLSVGGYVYATSSYLSPRQPRWRLIVILALALLALDVLVILMFMRSRGAV